MRKLTVAVIIVILALWAVTIFTGLEYDRAVREYDNLDWADWRAFWREPARGIIERRNRYLWASVLFFFISSVLALGLVTWVLFSRYHK